MAMATWFDDLPVLGAMPPDQAAAKLREVGEDEFADVLAAAPVSDTETADTYGWRALFAARDKLWAHTGHAIGFVAAATHASGPLPVVDAGGMPADATLRRGRINVTLNRLRVADYPGRGAHRVLVDFYAQNQTDAGPEHVHFNATYRVREGETAGIVGYPVFTGLRVGSEGVAFKCFTVNVKNDGDERFLRFLESDVFASGLRLAGTAQPAIAPLSETAVALTRMVATRHRNVPVQDIHLGLDFAAVPMAARLAEGAYLAVQIPGHLQAGWEWNDWAYDPGSGQVVSRDDTSYAIPYNYLVFGVSRYHG